MKKSKKYNYRFLAESIYYLIVRVQLHDLLHIVAECISNDFRIIASEQHFLRLEDKISYLWPMMRCHRLILNDVVTICVYSQSMTSLIEKLIIK